MSAEQYQPNYEDIVSKPMSLNWPAPNAWVFITQLCTALQHLLMQRPWVRICPVPGLENFYLDLTCNKIIVITTAVITSSFCLYF